MRRTRVPQRLPRRPLHLWQLAARRPICRVVSRPATAAGQQSRDCLERPRCAVEVNDCTAARTIEARHTDMSLLDQLLGGLTGVTGCPLRGILMNVLDWRRGGGPSRAPLELRESWNRTSCSVLDW